MRYLLIPFIALMLTGCVAPPHRTSVTVGVSSPNVRVSLHVPAYPDMVPVPGYPVYYAPGLGYNYFFYDGLYWVYYGDYWYSSTWYNGPWEAVHPYDVPAFILRVPVRYYRVPPRHFHGWHPDAPPRWGERWGRDWDQRRSGWDHWDRRAESPRAPLPYYQREYSGQRYPKPEQQRELNRDRYQPGDSMGRDRDRDYGPDRRDSRAPTMGVPPGFNTNPGNAPMQMGRDAPPREQPRGMPNAVPPMQMGRDPAPPAPQRSMPGRDDMPPQMRREPPQDAQMRGQPAEPMAVPGRSRGWDERRGEDRGEERGRNDRRQEGRSDERRGDRDNNGDRRNERRGNGERSR